MMTNDETEKLRLTISKNQTVLSDGVQQLPPSQAPGGSVCFRKDIFKSIGGFDPEFFDLYNCEDAAIWIKANRYLTPEPYPVRAVSPHRGHTPDLSEVYALHQFHEIPNHDASDMGAKFWIPDFMKYASDNLMKELLNESSKYLTYERNWDEV